MDNTYKLESQLKKYTLDLKRANVIVGSGGEVTNAVWGTITGDIKQQSDLQAELTTIKESIPEPYNDTEIKEDISNLESTKADKTELSNLATKDELAGKADSSSLLDLATKEELNSKQDTLVSGTTIKTVNGESLLGEGNITIQSGTSNWNDIQGKPEFATVATTGSYNDLSDKPEIPSDYIENITDSDTEFSIDTAFNYKSGKKYSLSFSKTGGFDVIIGGVGDTQRNINLSIDTDIIATKEDLADYQPVGDYATKTELASKQDTLVSGTNIKTINNQSLLGSGNIQIEGGGTITVDSELSTTSENPVQNKVIANAINAKQDAGDYALKSDISTLATKEELAGKLDTSVYNEEKATFALKSEIPDTSNFATKAEVTDGLATKLDSSTYSTDKPTFALKTEIPDTSNLATKEELNSKANTSDVYTKTEVDSKIDEAITGGEVDLSNYYTKSETYSKAEVDGKIPDISGLATKEELASKADSSALSNYATKTDLDGKLDASTYNSDKAGFATKAEIPDISNLATKAELPTATSDLTNDSGYITSIPEEYITETELESKGYAVNSTVVSTYATKSEVNEQLGNINTILDTIIGQYSWAEF